MINEVIMQERYTQFNEGEMAKNGAGLDNAVSRMIAENPILFDNMIRWGKDIELLIKDREDELDEEGKRIVSWYKANAVSYNNNDDNLYSPESRINQGVQDLRFINKNIIRLVAKLILFSGLRKHIDTKKVSLQVFPTSHVDETDSRISLIARFEEDKDVESTEEHTICVQLYVNKDVTRECKRTEHNDVFCIEYNTYTNQERDTRHKHKYLYFDPDALGETINEFLSAIEKGQFPNISEIYERAILSQKFNQTIANISGDVRDHAASFLHF